MEMPERLSAESAAPAKAQLASRQFTGEGRPR